MNTTIQTWLAAGPLLTDGGWGTQLQLRGLAVGKHPDYWNLTNPEKVQEVARAYVDAGSRVILTNTFGSNRFILGRHGFDDKVAEINAEGVRLSRNAARNAVGSATGNAVDGIAKVFASIGPTGVVLMMGQVSEEQLYSAFHEQATALAQAQPDALVVETMSDLAEAVIAVRAAKTTGLPVVACVVFDSGKNKDRTMMGQTPEQAVEMLTEAGADVLGSNCGQGIDGFIPLCRRMRAATTLPLWMKANAGLPRMVDGKTVYDQSPDEFAEKAMQLIEVGADFIGGCCGTSPEFIAAVKKRLTARSEK
ncbi:MAG TPA: methionine synthase [Planctomycetaceae bacterium]|nr:methionine synthase [Planctomycetaceae bacterium]